MVPPWFLAKFSMILLSNHSHSSDYIGINHDRKRARNSGIRCASLGCVWIRFPLVPRYRDNKKSDSRSSSADRVSGRIPKQNSGLVSPRTALQTYRFGFLISFEDMIQNSPFCGGTSEESRNRGAGSPEPARNRGTGSSEPSLFS